MKLDKLATLLACTTLLTFSLSAAPTHVRHMESNGSETVMEIEQDENELTHVSVKQGDDKHEFTFTANELSDPSTIKGKLSALPEKTSRKLTRLLTKMSVLDQGKFKLLHNKEMDIKTKEKLAAIAKKMEGKEVEMEFIARKLEAKAAELEAHALELESLHELREGEYEIIIDTFENSIDEVMSSLGEMEIDIDFDHENGHTSRFVIIDDHQDINRAQHLIRMIKNSKLTEEQKQAIKEALE
ncbi:hypothetical protein [Shewanella nanhaiensis]|uniref:DUF5667 domain-containing protein n=1 Tax=Shewanella nanhaiensis TaxID=2864872 RepID=A0ABS7E861_9GAMM|nr:hypothetical protein [Shewanella nanhaiensis]MBW8185876.1 hypothetical protein [Shewanella nanhaiensis]